MAKNIGITKPNQEQMKEIIKAFQNKGIEVKVKEGYGEPSNPHWSASIGKSYHKELIIK
ncbi:hypothetical protein [Massilibacterium senegalense]|uniref:hypothetical protein n=1 Tax=Massilibacterium senegalense TaxID=1632858 RepID=UPI0012B5E1A0|nr:hypothetical protein [Massilibacterium senegalense]